MSALGRVALARAHPHPRAPAVQPQFQLLPGLEGRRVAHGLPALDPVRDRALLTGVDVYGIGAVLLAVVLHSASSVWVKVINARLPALE